MQLDQFDLQGVELLKQCVPHTLLEAVRQRLPELTATRGHLRGSNRYVSQPISGTGSLSQLWQQWWSQSVLQWPVLQQIHHLLWPRVLVHMPTAELYAADFVTVCGPSEWVNPHVDTPHRFEPFNHAPTDGVMGVQAVVALEDCDATLGATGVVLGSHRKDWQIQRCYAGDYTEYFLKNVQQYRMPAGSVLLYNSAVLHSSMPIRQHYNRTLLLINYLRSDCVSRVRQLDDSTQTPT